MGLRSHRERDGPESSARDWLSAASGPGAELVGRVNASDDGEPSVRRTFWHPWSVISGTTFLYWLGAHTLRPFVTLRLDDLGASDALIGLAIALSPAVALVLALPIGRTVDRVGPRRVLILSLLGMSVLGMRFAFAGTPNAILGLQAGIGIAEMGTWLALQSLITSAGQGVFRTRQLSLFAFAWGAGVAVGPVVGAGLFDAIGFASLGWTYAGCSIFALGTVAVLPHPPHDPSSVPGDRRLSIAAVVRSIVGRPALAIVLLSSYVNLAVAAMRSSFYPLYLERQGVSVSRIGILLSVVAVASLGVRIALPSLVRWFSAFSLLVMSMVLSTLALALTPFLPGFATLATAAAIMGIALGVNPPLTVGIMADHTSPTERGVAMGLRVAVNRMAQVIQPLAFTAIAAVAGMAAAFPLTAIPLLASTVWMGRQSRPGGREVEPSRGRRPSV